MVMICPCRKAPGRCAHWPRLPLERPYSHAQVFAAIRQIEHLHGVGIGKSFQADAEGFVRGCRTPGRISGKNQRDCEAQEGQESHCFPEVIGRMLTLTLGEGSNVTYLAVSKRQIGCYPVVIRAPGAISPSPKARSPILQSFCHGAWATT
jgi:hypothetical protein